LDEFSLEIYFNFNFYFFKLKFLFTISPDSKLIITKTKIIIYCELYSIQHVPTMCMGLKPLAAADRCSFFHPQGWACLAPNWLTPLRASRKGFALRCCAAGGGRLRVLPSLTYIFFWNIYIFKIRIIDLILIYFGYIFYKKSF
jgi:hypothetical protein